MDNDVGGFPMLSSVLPMALPRLAGFTPAWSSQHSTWCCHCSRHLPTLTVLT